MRIKEKRMKSFVSRANVLTQAKKAGRSRHLQKHR